MEESNERLKEVYVESEMRSVTAFAKFCRVNQKTMDNYIKGLFKPSVEKLEMVLEVFPQYNREWLIFGTGPKYNPDYVGEHYIDFTHQEQVAQPKQEIAPAATNNTLSDELRKSKDRLVARMLRRLNAIMKLDELGKVKDEIQGLILDLEDEQK